MKSRTIRLSFEVLENRQMLAGDPAVDPAGNSVAVTAPFADTMPIVGDLISASINDSNEQLAELTAEFSEVDAVFSELAGTAPAIDTAIESLTGPIDTFARPEQNSFGREDLSVPATIGGFFPIVFDRMVLTDATAAIEAEPGVRTDEIRLSGRPIAADSSPRGDEETEDQDAGDADQEEESERDVQLDRATATSITE